jgi:phosphoribosylformimino-5-aminoimidazole carboxamide ribonucleotide (ProFAR) isomerase
VLAGCGGLNPSFLTTLGVNPINSLDDSPGSILVLFINRTAFVAETQVRMFEESGFQSVTQLRAASNEYFVTGIDCEVTSMVVESATVRVTAAGGATSDVDVTVPETPLFGGVNYVCGRILVITVSGTENNFQVDTRIE